jgi:type II secretion system protein H
MIRSARVHRGGFTLLELVLVSAIIVIFAAVAMPRYGRAAARYQIDLAARRVAADLAQAQSYARTTGASQTVVFSVAANRYQLMNALPLDGVSGPYTVDLAAEPYRARLVSANFNGAAQAVFNGWGLPDSGGSVVVAVGLQQQTVTVDDETGQISVQ